MPLRRNIRRTFLPTTVIRHLLDANGKNISQAISHDGLSQQCHKMDKPLSRKIVGSQKSLLEKLLKLTNQRHPGSGKHHCCCPGKNACRTGP